MTTRTSIHPNTYSEDRMHDYINGLTCPRCGKSGIPCTIEDGFCENEGDCDNCIKDRYYRQMEREDSWEYDDA